MKFKIKILIILGILMALIGGALIWDYFKSVSSPKSKYYCQTDFDCVLSGSDPEGFGICVNKEWYEEWKKNPESKKYRWECEYTGKEKCGCINNRCQRIDSGIGRGVKENQVINTSNWKTYRNEEYGFEIDYPIDNWEFKYREPFFLLSKRLAKKEKDAFGFYITAEIEFLSNDECSKYSLEEIVKKRELMLKCVVNNFVMDFEEEIITNFGVKGYKGKGGGYYYGIKGTGVQAVIFPILKEIYWDKTRVKWGETYFRPILIIYCDLETHHTDEDIEIFNKIVSSFRYIKK